MREIVGKRGQDVGAIWMPVYAQFACGVGRILWTCVDVQYSVRVYAQTRVNLWATTITRGHVFVSAFWAPITRGGGCAKWARPL